MILVIAGNILFFIVTALQFWITDYLRVVMKVEEGKIFAAFVVTCVTAPTLGIILGGVLVQKCGGYEGKHSITFVFAFAIISTLFGSFMTQLTTLESFAPCLWLFFFFGGGLVPNLVGNYSILLKELLSLPYLLN